MQLIGAEGECLYVCVWVCGWRLQGRRPCCLVKLRPAHTRKTGAINTGQTHGPHGMACLMHPSPHL